MEELLNFIDPPPLEFEKELKVPLSSTTETTRGDALIMCLAYGFRHCLSWKAIEDLLKMINCLFGQEVVKSSKYFFTKYMEGDKGKMTYHLYCPHCERYLGVREDFQKFLQECPCGKSFQDISDAKTFFISLNLQDQLQDLLKDRTFVEALRHRFQRKKEQEDAYEDIFDGEVYRNLSAPGQVLSHWYNMSYTLNTDGFPVGGKFGKQSCWPIYIQINELPHKLRSKFMLLAGIFVGKKDPNMNVFMYPFVKEANKLSTLGVNWCLNNQDINSKVIPLCACVDTPARHKILNTTSFNGLFGCSLCYTNPESTAVGKRYSLSVNGLVERKHEEILSDASKAHANRTLVRNKKNRRVRGVKGPAPIHNMRYLNLVKGVRPDTMHSILLGNGKHHVSVLHDSPGKLYYIGSDVRMLSVSNRLLTIRPPSSLLRVPRDFSQFGSWTAKEWRLWLLFYATPCLLNIIPREYVSHVNLLSSALHIILRKSITKSDLEKAHILVLRYVFLFEQYYGKEQMVINIHLLLHLKKSIEYLGPAWTNVAFGFEGANKTLLEMKKGPSSIAQEIARKYLVFRSLPILCERYATTDNTLDFCQNLSGRTLLKSFTRIGDTVLLGRGNQAVLDQNEHECLMLARFVNFTEVLAYERFILGGIRYCTSSYNRASKTDDSYICIQNESRGRIQKILRCVEGGNLSVKLLVREILIDDEPVFDDEFGKHSTLLKIKGEGQLLTIIPEDISGQCVAMFLESGSFIVDVPYGCYGDS